MEKVKYENIEAEVGVPRTFKHVLQRAGATTLELERRRSSQTTAPWLQIPKGAVTRQANVRGSYNSEEAYVNESFRKLFQMRL
jgi:hypothetical protein